MGARISTSSCAVGGALVGAVVRALLGTGRSTGRRALVGAGSTAAGAARAGAGTSAGSRAGAGTRAAARARTDLGAGVATAATAASSTPACPGARRAETIDCRNIRIRLAGRIRGYRWHGWIELGCGARRLRGCRLDGQHQLLDLEGHSSLLATGDASVQPADTSHQSQPCLLS